ncbi:hypothetical protein PBS_07650 [Paraburkholderia sp. 2C]
MPELDFGGGLRAGADADARRGERDGDGDGKRTDERLAMHRVVSFCWNTLRDKGRAILVAVDDSQAEVIFLFVKMGMIAE